VPAQVVTIGKINNMNALAEYAEKAMPIVMAYGARMVTGGPVVATIEGDMSNERVAIFEFDDIARAEACFSSPEYQALNDQRDQAGSFEIFIIQVGKT